MHVWIAPSDGQDRKAVLDEAVGALAVHAPSFVATLGKLLAQPAGVAVKALLAAVKDAEAKGAGLAGAVFDGTFRALAVRGCLRFGSASSDEAILTVQPVGEAELAPLLAMVEDGKALDGTWRLSRFAMIRRVGNTLLVERPMSGYRASLCTRTVAGGALVALLSTGAKRDDLGQSGAPVAQHAPILAMLALAGVIAATDDKGQLPEDRDETLRQWEPEDLVFHARSRMGFTPDPVGATFRFKDTLPATPAIRVEPANLGRVPLFVPDLAGLSAQDITLTQAIEARCSRRPRARRALSLGELGAFLFRSARIRSYQETPGGSFTSRPYPSGGGSYESEIYVTAQNVAGLRPGFYFYAALTHELLLLREWDAEVASVAQDALRAMAMLSPPDAVLTFGSRFQRVQWKYSGMAYATQLKNTGAAYMAFYLTATSMGLSPCGLGLGNAATFARLTGLDPHKEGSIGEFALSGPGDG